MDAPPGLEAQWLRGTDVWPCVVDVSCQRAAVNAACAEKEAFGSSGLQWYSLQGFSNNSSSIRGVLALQVFSKSIGEARSRVEAKVLLPLHHVDA